MELLKEVPNKNNQSENISSSTDKKNIGQQEEEKINPRNTSKL